MEFQIERKREIVSVIKEKHDQNQLSQDFLLDMQQEINRCNHIMKHILRSQYNFTGRLYWAGVFSFLAILWSSDRVSNRTRLSLKNGAFIMGSAFAGALIGYYYFGAKFFGNLPDYRKNLDVYFDSLNLDREVEPIVKGFRV